MTSTQAATEHSSHLQWEGLQQNCNAEPAQAVAVVTGGCSGIGCAVVQALSPRLTSVMVADTAPPPELPHNTVYCRTDVTQRNDIDTLYTTTIQELGTPGILVCNAGRGIHERLNEGDPEKWKDVFDTNVMGALRVVRAFLPAMLDAGGGDIVFISSVAAQHAYEWGGVYASSKAALEMIAETLRLEVLPTVRVVTIAPGVVDTAFFRHATGHPPTPDEIGWGALPPEEVAGAVLYALARPRGVAVNHITLRPAAQPL